MAAGFSVFVSIGAKLLPSLTSSTNAVVKQFGMMNNRLKVQALETKLAFKEMTSSLGPLTSFAAAGGLAAGLKGVLGEGNEFQHQVSLMRIAGRSAGDLANAMAAANQTMLSVPTSTLNGNLALLNETTLAYGSMSHALDNLTFNAKLGSLLTSIGGDKFGDTGAVFNTLVRGLEIRGSALDPKRYQREAGSLFQAMAATHGVVGPDEILDFVQQSNPAVRGYSERFFTRIAPSLIQEFGGGRAGTALTAFNNQILGRVPLGGKSLVQEWVKLGLVPAPGTGGNLSRTGWSPGSLKDTSLAMSDPLAWTERDLLPALQRSGVNINDEGAMTLAAKRLFGRETGARLASTLLSPTQRGRLHKDEGLFEKAMKPNDAYASAMKNDPTMAWAETRSALTNLETVLGKVAAKPLASAMNGIAHSLEYLVGVFDQHPNFAKGVDALLGFGLAVATLKTFGIAVRWLATGPLGLVLDLAGGLLTKLPLLGNVLLGFVRTGLGRALVGGLVRLGPMIVEGLATAFGLLSNPIGWAIILAGVGLTLAYYFRADIAKAWHFVTGWFTTTGLPGIKAAMLTFDWSGVGAAIANAMTFGLASKINPSVWGSILRGAAGGFLTGGIGGAIAGGSMAAGAAAAHGTVGKRALGGPIRAGQWYHVNERGEESFMSTRPGSIRPAGGRTANDNPSVSFRDIVINGATDPHATARAVRAELGRMARGQNGYLND